MLSYSPDDTRNDFNKVNINSTNILPTEVRARYNSSKESHENTLVKSNTAIDFIPNSPDVDQSPGQIYNQKINFHSKGALISDTSEKFTIDTGGREQFLKYIG